MSNDYYPVVVQAVAGDGYKVFVYFSDGTIHLYDMSRLIEQGGVFEPLRDKKNFVNKLTVLNDTVAWDLSGRFDPTDCIDIDPFEVYQAEIVQDPLESIA